MSNFIAKLAARKSQPTVYSPREEAANYATHFAGALFSLVALASLVFISTQNGDALRVFSFTVFGAAMTMLYACSTLYHWFQAPRVKRNLRVLDHISIYLLICGSYTPFTLISLRGAWGWFLFGLVWGMAAFGIVFKLFMTGRWNLLSSMLYLAMGWVVVVAIKPLANALPSDGMMWLVAGGCAYSFGVIFYSCKKLPYHHAVWHCFVLAGSVCHYCAVLTIAPID